MGRLTVTGLDLEQEQEHSQSWLRLASYNFGKPIPYLQQTLGCNYPGGTSPQPARTRALPGAIYRVEVDSSTSLDGLVD